MIQGVGCDILEIKHFEEVFRMFPSMLNRLYSTKEIAEYHKRNDDIRFLAARFFAKEAIIKALKEYNYALNTIEILDDERNVPRVTFLNNKYDVMVSISYEKDYVISYATLLCI